MEKKEKEVAEEYLSSLVDLNVNSKPLINMLTILAEENIEYGQTIVNAVEQHIAKIDPEVKLPVLYLIDSIVKNVGREYTTLFSHSIVNIFCGVFEKVNEKIRSKMFALRQTWNDVFPAPKLYTLDVKVNCMDPGWPITAKVTPSIHVNPNFFKTKPENEMQAQLRDKQRELLELQKRKLELELAATKKHIEEQEKQLSMQAASIKTTKPPINVTNKPETETVPRSQQQSTATTTTQNTTTVSQASTAASRPRIAPVNQALISSVRLRDPRIARQLQTQVVVNQRQRPTDRFSTGNTESTNQNNTSQTNSTESSGQKQLKSSALNNKDKDNTTINKDEKTRLSPKSLSKSNSKFSSSDRSPTRTSTKSSSSRNSTGTSYKAGNSSNNKSPLKDRTKHRKESSSKSSLSSYRSSSGNSNSSDRKKSTKLNATSTSSSSSSSSSNVLNKEKMISKSYPKILKTTTGQLFKDVRSSSKNRNYIRKNREDSKSPPPPPPSICKDFDMRSMLKKVTKPSISPIPPEPPTIKQDPNSTDIANNTPIEQVTVKVDPADIKIETMDVESSLASSSPLSSNRDHLLESTSKLIDQKSKIEVDNKDVDLRSGGVSNCSNEKAIISNNISTNINTIASTLISTISSTTVAGDIPTNSTALGSSLMSPVINAIKSEASMPAKTIDLKKRLSQEQLCDEPLAKKTKSENIDDLFGKEDVDYRTQLNPVLNQALKAMHAPTPPPPPQISTAQAKTVEGWATIKAEIPKQPNTTLDAVRAKLAEATRTKEFTQNNRNSKDIDLRLRPPSELTADENSQEGNEAKFKMIVTQAQEQLYNENINLEQYNNLMRQVMQIRTIHKRETMKRKNNPNLNDMLTPISDDEVEFSTSGSESDTRSKNNLKRDRPMDVQNSTATPQDSSSNDVQNSKPKGKRQRKTKWSPSPWETPQPNIQSSHMYPANSVASQILQQTTKGFQAKLGTTPSPWSTVPLPFATTQIPGLSQSIQVNNGISPFASQQQMINLAGIPKSSDRSDRTISIDGIPREIRFYEEVAIAFMGENGKEPKEIGFQSGERHVVFDNKDKVLLAFNDVYKPFVIDGKTHHIRFGSPMRELYIDNNWYECFFGNTPSTINLDGKIRVLVIEGPAPQVRIGNLRTDLVVGKVDLYVDAMIKIPLYLDAQVQTFELANQVHTIQFADYLLTVLIDKQPFIVEYGGMPKKFRIGNQDRYIRFSILPNDICPGMVYIKNMIRTEYHKGIASPPPITIADIVPPPAVVMPTLPTVTGATEVPNLIAPVVDTTTASVPTMQTNDIVSNTPGINTLAPNPIVPAATQINPTNSINIPPVPSMNIGDLLQKLLASGILKNTKTDTDVKLKEKEKFKPITLNKPENWKQRQPALINVLFSGMQCSSCGVRFPPEHSMKYSQHLDWHFRQNRRDRDSARRAHSRRWYYDVADWIQYEEVEDIEDREKNWFEAQQSAMSPSNEDSAQRNESPLPSCIAGPDDVDKTCDICHDQFETFFNEDNEEWHLRNALRVDDKTYHPICYEDYKASLEADEAETLNGDGIADDNAVDITVAEEEKIVLDDDDDVDDVIVLPQEEPIVTEIPDDEDDSVIPKDMPVSDVDVATEAEAETEVKNEESKIESTEESPKIDDEPLEETIEKTEKEQTETDPTETVNKEPEGEYEQVGNETDIQILVPQISVLDLDEFEEKPRDETVDETSQPSVKIKEEPIDDGYEDDDGFVEVGTFESTEITESIIADDYDSQPPSTATSTVTLTVSSSHQSTAPPVQTTLVTTLDGNVENTDTHPTFGTNKIKINITKNVMKNVNNKSSENTQKQNDSSKVLSNDSQQYQQQQLQQQQQNESEISALEDIEFEFKPSMRNVAFNKKATVKSGLDTSESTTTTERRSYERSLPNFQKIHL